MDPRWHGLRIGDWGTWLAGVATLLAVVVAIVVPWVLEYWRRKELARQAARSAHILAIELYEPLKRLHGVMTTCRSVLRQALEGSSTAIRQDWLSGANCGGLTNCRRVQICVVCRFPFHRVLLPCDRRSRSTTARRVN